MQKKKFVLITGVSTGIGNDAARFLIKKGYHVLGSVRKEQDKTLLEEEFPKGFTCLKFDVTQPEEVKAAIPQVKEILGNSKLSGLINNAGLALVGPLEVMDDEKFRYQMEVNVFSVRTVTNAFLPFLKGSRENKVPGGKIIMISSVSGIINTPFNGAYCISKHAMESMAEIYRRELMIYDIDVVSIQPGPIKSKLWEKSNNVNVVFRDTAYGKLVDNASQVMEEAERDALPASIISNIIYKILSKRKTRLSFVVIKNKFFIQLVAKIVPRRWVDRTIYKRFFL